MGFRTLVNLYGLVLKPHSLEALFGLLGLVQGFRVEVAELRVSWGSVPTPP